MKKYSIYFGLVASWLIFTACPEDTPPVQNRDTTIQLSEVSTVIFSTNLKVSVTDTSDSWTFELTRDDSTILISEVFNSDTTIKDNALSNVTQYNYQAYWLKDGERADSSETVTITTNDTTSHNFIWEIDTLGNYGSYLNDVAIVDENNIWVVGNIETDSSAYNAAHWDGSEWELMGIYSNTLDLYNIYYFSEDDIWVTDNSFPIHWDGNNWTLYHLQNMGIHVSVNEIWGTSSSNMYFVGRNGSIVHYDGSNFIKMESGTDLHLRRIAGSEETGQIFVSGYTNQDGVNSSIVLEYKNDEWITFYESDNVYGDTTNNDYGWALSLDLYGDTTYIATISEFMFFNIKTYEYRLVKASSIINTYGYLTIKVQNENDIILFSGGGHIVHYNGSTWNLQTIPTATYGGGDIKGDLSVYVGSISNGPAVIAFGRR